MRDNIFGVKLYRAQEVGTNKYIEGYPVVVEVIDCGSKKKKNAEKESAPKSIPKYGYEVHMYTTTTGSKLKKLVGTNTYVLVPKCVRIDPSTLVCISDKDDILN